MTRQTLTPDLVAELSREVHADNVAAGWWTDLATGESLIGKRNVGELLMLIVSEVCEASDGLQDNLPDDKLPHRQMIEVELADFLIRAFDLAGGLSIEDAFAEQFGITRPTAGNAYSILDTPSDYLLRIIRFVSAAMEHHRKGRVAMMATPLALALHGAMVLGEILDLDVMAAVAEKRAFNKSREDHQVANRRTAGGKAY